MQIAKATSRKPVTCLSASYSTRLHTSKKWIRSLAANRDYYAFFNHETYPQPSSQKPGLDLSQCRLVGLICLASGALVNAAMGMEKLSLSVTGDGRESDLGLSARLPSGPAADGPCGLVNCHTALSAQLQA